MSNYMAIKTNDINNGPGLRVSFWFSGCDFRCKNCHNREAWDFHAGKEVTDEVIEYTMGLLGANDILDLSVLGGEPLHPNNLEATAKLVKRCKELYPNKKVWIWTGYKFESLLNMDSDSHISTILRNTDVIVDGLFDESLHCKSLKFRGSSNQRVINVVKTFKEGKTVLEIE